MGTGTSWEDFVAHAETPKLQGAKFLLTKQDAPMHMRDAADLDARDAADAQAHTKSAIGEASPTG